MKNARRMSTEELQHILRVIEPLFERVEIRKWPGAEEIFRTGEEAVCSRPILLETPTEACQIVLEVAQRKSGLRETGKDERYIDELTGAYNRRYLNRFCFLNDKAAPCSVGVILMDIRQFKKINDTLGHLAGDRILQRIAASLRGHIREEDALIRWGGDEFIVILTQCGEQEVLRKIEELRTMINAIAAADFGYAWSGDFCAKRQCLLQLLEQADQRMYVEKRSLI